MIDRMCCVWFNNIVILDIFYGISIFLSNLSFDWGVRFFFPLKKSQQYVIRAVIKHILLSVQFLTSPEMEWSSRISVVTFLWSPGSCPGRVSRALDWPPCISLREEAAHTLLKIALKTQVITPCEWCLKQTRFLHFWECFENLLDFTRQMSCRFLRHITTYCTNHSPHTGCSVPF